MLPLSRGPFLSLRQLRRAILAGPALIAMTAAQATEPIILASATTPEAAGLYGHLLPRFEEKTGIDVRVVAVGTGQALEIGRRGDADVLLLHHPPSERRFVEQGFGVRRHPVMYNDFVLVGPHDDPARVRGLDDASAALERIAESRTPFASRGDHSGTHRKERELWRAVNIDPAGLDGGWYRELGAGMGATLHSAAAMSAYALTDRGTWLAFENRQGLELLVENDPRLSNPYTAILVDPERHPHVNAGGGRRFIRWLTSEPGQRAIASYRLRGARPFHPDAERPAKEGR